MQVTPDNNSYDSMLKKLQKIYQQQSENTDNIKDRTNDIVMPEQEQNNMVGSLQLFDSGDVSIKPTTSDTMIATEAGIFLPTDVNYTFTHNFTFPEKFLSFLGFENYFKVQSPSKLVSGFIGQASAFNSAGYKIVADGTTVWDGLTPPKNYLDTLTLTDCQANAKYFAPAWQVTMPAPNSGGPVFGTYDFVGFMIKYDVVQLTPNTTGQFFGYKQFWAYNVIGISGTDITGTGLFVEVDGFTNIENLRNMKSGVVPVPPEATIAAADVPSYMDTGIWPQTWQNPNDLSHVIPGLSPIIPGQYVQFTGNSHNGEAIYQPPPSLQFITPGSIFVGVTFEAHFPTIPEFIAAGIDPSEATSIYSQIFDQWGNNLGGGTIVNAANQLGNGWDTVRVPGDMNLSGVSSDAQIIAFNLMWTNFLAGGNPSWFYLANANNFTGGSNVFPVPTFTYGVTMTFNLANINAIFLSPAGTSPGNEVMFPAFDPNAGDYPTMSSHFPAFTNWTFQQNKYRVFYDSTFTCPLFLLNYPTNPNIGRPDQHESMNPIYNLAGGFNIAATFINSDAGCSYFFPFRTIELSSNPVASAPLNTAVLDNTFDPFFIRKSKTTDNDEIWTVSYYYSAIVLAPTVFKEETTTLQLDDSTIFQFTVNHNGYVVNFQEGVAPWTTFFYAQDNTFPNGHGTPTVLSGPSRYSVSTPNTVNHNEQTVKVFAPDPSDLITRVKVALKSPLNWLKLNKYDAQEI